MKTLLLIPTFLILGQGASAGQMMASHAPSRTRPVEAARVNGVPIMSDRLDAALHRLIPFESFHRNVSAEKVDELRRQALGDLVDDELRYQDGVRAGLAPPEREIDAELGRAIARFKTRGEFEQALRQSGVSMSDVRKEIRRQLVVKMAYEHAVASRCQVTSEEAARFFAGNPGRFVVPETLHLYAITIGVDPSSPSSQWIDARNRAEDLLRSLQGGLSFEDAARKHSTDASRDRGGDMGLVHRGSLNDQFEQAAKDLEPGEMSGVVQSLYGFHIIKLASVRPPQQMAFADVSTAVRKDLSARRCADMKASWTAGLRASAKIVISGGTELPKVRPSGTTGDR